MPASLRLTCCLLIAAGAAAAEEIQFDPGPGGNLVVQTQSFVYKETKQAGLELVVHCPPGWKETDKRPASVFFFGGGWTSSRSSAPWSSGSFWRFFAGADAGDATWCTE